MNEITSLFTAIGNFLTQNDWYPMVKWPFWILLTVVAASGIYCARFGKKTLLNQAVSCTLSLTAIYLFLMILCISSPFVREHISILPYLSATNEAASINPPITLDPVLVASQMLRLMILTLWICFTDIFFVSGKTFITWGLSQLISTFAVAIIYSGITEGLPYFMPFLKDCRGTNYVLLVFMVLLLLFGLWMFCMKIVFTMILPGGAPFFGTIHKFFTTTRGGSWFTITFISSMLFLFVLGVLSLFGYTTVTYATANVTGLAIILALILATQYCFAKFFIDRTKS